MNVTFRIELDCSDRLLTAVENLTTILSSASTTSVASPAPVQIAEEPKRTTRKIRKLEKPVEASHEEKTEEHTQGTIVFDETKEESKGQEAFDVEKWANKDKENPKQEAETPKTDDKPKEISDADLRAAMKSCRARVLGDNQNDPILKTALNQKMREKVKQMGYDASTAIPADKRQEFIDFLNVVTIDATDNDNAPF